MSKPKFDPNKPYTPVKPKFDPNQPFEVVGAGNKLADGKFDPSKVTDTLKDIAVSAGQGATYNWLDEAVGLFNKEAGEDFKKWTKEAVKRSPVISVVSESAGEAISPITKPLRGGKIIKSAIEGGLQALGASEEKEIPRKIGDVALGMGVGGASSAVGSLIKPTVTMSPNATRAKVLGAGSKEFGESGVMDREAIAKELNSMGLFSNQKVDFDVRNNKFIKSKSSLDNLESPLPDKLMGRIGNAQEKINEETGRILSRWDNKSPNLEKLRERLELAADEFASKRPGKYQESMDMMSGIIDNIMMELNDVARRKGKDFVTYSMVNDKKKDLYKYAGRYGKGIADTADTDLMYQSLARGAKDFLNDNIGEKDFQRLNETYHKFAVAGGDLEKKINALKGRGATSPGRIDPYNLVERGLYKAVGGEDTSLSSASAKEVIDQYVPETLKNIFNMSSKITPFVPGAILRQQFIGNRSPQSIDEVMNYKLPRNTDAILANPRAAVKKIMASTPEFTSDFEYAMKDPEALKTILPQLVAQNPGMFEKDDWGRVDGVVPPQLRPMATEKIRKMKNMDSIQKAKMIKSMVEDGILLE